MENVEKILRKQTMNLFNDDWYLKTSELISDIKDKQFGYVYFVRNGKSGLVKIGKAIDLNNRLKSFQTSFGAGVFLSAYIYCQNFSELEKNIHSLFLKQRKNGEWFDLDDSEFYNIESITKVGKYFSRGSSISFGEHFGLNDSKSEFGIENYYNEFFSFCEKLPKKTEQLKSEFYDSVLKLSGKYKTLSKKRANLILKKWCVENEIQYSDYNSNGRTYFILN